MRHIGCVTAPCVCPQHSSVNGTDCVKARRASYLALGDLAAAVGGNVKPYLDIVMQHFQAGLANKKLKRTHHVRPQRHEATQTHKYTSNLDLQIAIMTSFGRLAPAAGALLAPYVKEVLRTSFNMSEALNLLPSSHASFPPLTHTSFTQRTSLHSA